MTHIVVTGGGTGVGAADRESAEIVTHSGHLSSCPARIRGGHPGRFERQKSIRRLKHCAHLGGMLLKHAVESAVFFTFYTHGFSPIREQRRY